MPVMAMWFPALKPTFPLGERPRIPLEVRPCWLLPIPFHEE
jgi:hypothetical protein